MTAPGPDAELSVVVPSHARTARLAALLDALAGQTLARDRWEVVVVHDDGDAGATHDLLAGHALAAAGTLRAVAFPSGTGSAAAMRNAGWRAARGASILFTDDDCRPPPPWLEGARAAAGRHPWTVVQGATRPDPREWPPPPRSLLVRTQRIDPPTRWVQTCNVVYPRAVLERLGGFDERYRLPFGEDTDLGLRARRAGFGLIGAPEVVTFHAVETQRVRDRLRASRRIGQMALVARENPEYRWGPDQLLGLFVDSRHAWFLLATAGALGARRRPGRAALLAAPWCHAVVRAFAATPRARRTLPAWIAARALIDAVDIATMARASAHYRSLLL